MRDRTRGIPRDRIRKRQHCRMTAMYSFGLSRPAEHAPSRGFLMPGVVSLGFWWSSFDILGVVFSYWLLTSGTVYRGFLGSIPTRAKITLGSMPICVYPVVVKIRIGTLAFKYWFHISWCPLYYFSFREQWRWWVPLRSFSIDIWWSFEKFIMSTMWCTDDVVFSYMA